MLLNSNVNLVKKHATVTKIVMPPEPIKLVTQINQIQYTHEHFGLANITNAQIRLLADTT